MRKYLTIIVSSIILIFLVLFACSEIGGVRVGTSIGDSSTWPGCVQISLDHNKYDVNENVEIHFSYGHAYQNVYESPTILSHYLVVYIIDGNQSESDPENGIILYEHNITGDELLSDDYMCETGPWIFSRVKYINNYEVSVDFSEYDFDMGVICIRFYETSITEDYINEEIVYSEITLYNGTQIFYIKNDKTIEFSWR